VVFLWCALMILALSPEKMYSYCITHLHSFRLDELCGMEVDKTDGLINRFNSLCLRMEFADSMERSLEILSLNLTFVAL
jgi:hypothetical protein